ncbi:MAG: lysophospholipid acyltransferase family protein [Proteobacteria bacterium]|nr:lysophospholipid acyltransferase family protein [Pseudomonadota bacterium]
MISVEHSFFEKFPRLATGLARNFSRPVVELLRRIACEDRVNRALVEFASSAGFDFIERVLEKFDVGYRLSHVERENIPVQGRVVLVANHPLGAFDALALLHLVGSVRRDVRVLGNDVLAQFPQLDSLLLPINVFGGAGASTARLREAYRALELEQALIVFPAGEVSRICPIGVRDRRWSTGFVRMARRTGSPVLPVHIAAHNSPTFYGVSMLAKPLSSLLLAREMLAPQAQLDIRVGEPVAAAELGLVDADPDPVAQAMRRHVYQLARRRPTVFTTSRTIAHPESPLAIRQALKRAQELGTTQDGKRVLLLDAQPDCPVLREIGRLRELSFRRVGEGSGRRRDIDRFDMHYRHLVLWDEPSLAIIGAYRLGEGARILAEQGVAGLYSSTLFDYASQAREFIAQGVELGRSFIRPEYWNSRSLECLWQGIGAYLRHRPDLRYLFGPVSISATLPPIAREWIVHCHRHYFGDRESLAVARTPVGISAQVDAVATQAWVNKDARTGLLHLKRQLASLDVCIPPLYKHYVDLCEPEGVRFLTFGTDPGFGHCVDGLIRLDLGFLRASKRARYLQVA